MEFLENFSYARSKLQDVAAVRNTKTFWVLSLGFRKKSAQIQNSRSESFKIIK